MIDIDSDSEIEASGVPEYKKSGELPGPIAAIFSLWGSLMLVVNVVSSVIGMLQWWFIIPAAILKMCGVIHLSWFWIGSPLLVSLGLSLFGLVSALVMGGAASVFSSDRKQAWYELAWAATPLLLVLSFGFFGALLGAAGTFVNSRVFNSKIPTAAKYFVTAGISTSCFVIWVVGCALLSRK
jgi:hypothetical protein